MSTDVQMKCSKKPTYFVRSTKTNPLHWCLVLGISAACVAWMLVDTTSPVQYKHSVKYQPAAVKSLNLDDAYRRKIQTVASFMKRYCERGSHVIFAHNIEYEGKVLNDHMFHVCGGLTWLNARIVTKSTELVRCQEEYANLFKSRTQPKIVNMRGVNVESWSEKEVEGQDTVSCRWIHAIDILENRWL